MPERPRVYPLWCPVCSVFRNAFGRLALIGYYQSSWVMSAGRWTMQAPRLGRRATEASVNMPLEQEERRVRLSSWSADHFPASRDSGGTRRLARRTVRCQRKGSTRSDTGGDTDPGPRGRNAARDHPSQMASRWPARPPRCRDTGARRRARLVRPGKISAILIRALFSKTRRFLSATWNRSFGRTRHDAADPVVSSALGVARSRSRAPRCAPRRRGLARDGAPLTAADPPHSLLRSTKATPTRLSASSLPLSKVSQRGDLRPRAACSFHRPRL